MEEQTKVLVDLNEYKDFIISQYENGKLAKSLASKIQEMKKEIKKIEEEKEAFNWKLRQEKHKILEVAFKREKMGTDNRQEQTDYADGTFGHYFGIRVSGREFLKELGFTVQDMIDYINLQWDEREKPKETKENKDNE